MNINQWTKKIIEAPQRFTLPIMTHPGIEMIGCSVRDAVQDGTVHAQAIKALSDRFPSKAATVIMDLTVEAEAFGSRIEFPDNDMPHIIGRLVDSSSVESLQVPPLTVGRIPQYLEASRLAVEMISDKPVFAGAIGPFSLAGRLFDMSEIMVACYIEPEAIALLLEKCMEFILSYCRELKNTGCAGVIIAEPAAGLLSNEDCLQFSSVYIRQIVEAVQDDSFMVILHNCGNTGHCTKAMLDTGAGSYHFGNTIDMVKALDECPPDVLVMGNIDPVGILRMMTPGEVKKEVHHLLERTSAYPNFVLSTGCDVPPHVPVENIQAYYDALNEYNRKM
ncbi:uroporphyrinogen decarboxylase family protein [Parabacteroides pacaensis]|uniref:uroporphyrinogen decarboxylase family protein n=1 Tax=Parabacteroides pacaensis TaxID=2086575 RepID=UPI000D10BA85|nr:uroporphyrinogen decarboxylase family protein [Parabacteroides pacaensis]